MIYVNLLFLNNNNNNNNNTMLFIFSLLCLGSQQYWYVFIIGLFILIIYQSINYDNQPDIVLFGESQPWHPDLLFYYTFDPNRDAQAEGRTAHSTNENIRSFYHIEIEDDEPFGIQETQAHDLTILDYLNNIQRRINENAILYNNNILVSSIRNEMNVEIMMNNDDASEMIFNDSINIIHEISITRDNSKDILSNNIRLNTRTTNKHLSKHHCLIESNTHTE